MLSDQEREATWDFVDNEAMKMRHVFPVSDFQALAQHQATDAERHEAKYREMRMRWTEYANGDRTPGQSPTR